MKNDYEIRGDVTAIIINSQKFGRLEALISTNKLERAMEFSGSWHIQRNGNSYYVLGNTKKVKGKKGGSCYLHRWVTNAPVGMLVDHKNHDGLINTDENLRIATKSHNAQNLQGARKDSKSGILGVSWMRRDKKWCARTMVDGRYRSLGYFDDIKEAERAVKEARAKHMPFSKEYMMEA